MKLSDLIKNLLSKFTRRAYERNTQRQYVSDEILEALRAGIKQGKSIPNLAKIIRSVSDRSRNSSIMTARTETTRIQSKAREDAFDRARSLGVVVDNQWMATNDARTRDSHAAIDGEIVEKGETFSNGLRFPGDPSGLAEEVINCRCTLLPVIRN